MEPILRLYDWFGTIGEQPSGSPYAKNLVMGETAERKTADTCIGWARRGRQAPHAL